jgi:hypothetical protein
LARSAIFKARTKRSRRGQRSALLSRRVIRGYAQCLVV